MTKRVKVLILVGLLLVLGTQLVFMGLEPDDADLGIRQVPPGQGNQTVSSPTHSASMAFSRPPARESIELSTPRNIFAPLKKPPVPKKEKPAPRKIAKREILPPKKEVKPVAVPPPKPVRPPGPTPEDLAKRQAEQEMNKYRFLGYLERAGEQHVFLSNGQALYIIKQGETVEGAITLKSIMESSVVLSKSLSGMGTTVEATLPLTKDAQGT